MNYLDLFPLPADQIPNTLKSMLTVEDNQNPTQKINVTSRVELDKYQTNYEYLHMVLALVPEDKVPSLNVLRESSDGVVSHSTPICDNKGDLIDLNHSISSYKYLIASWGDSSHYAFNLSENVWMTLGLTPRLIGDTEQRIIYDDLSAPELSIVEGNVSSEYHFISSRNIFWTMRNDYLRKYLWMTGCSGVRVFFYESYIEITNEVKQFLAGKTHVCKNLKGDWAELDIRIIDDKALLQMWATVESIKPELCNELDIDSLIWPEHVTPMTKQRSRDYRLNEDVYVKDEFLVKYEKDCAFDAIPFVQGNSVYCSPSYKGQWAFRDCIRVGRNLVRIPLYELYRAIPEQEVYHVFGYAIKPSIANTFDFEQENIVLKSHRLLKQLISLGENLVTLGSKFDFTISTSDVSPFNRAEYENEGFRDIHIFQKLSQVAPENMFEQDFLSRCKTLNEIINLIKPGTLKKLLKALGIPSNKVSNLKTLKLLQALLNITQIANDQNEDCESLKHIINEIDWNQSNSDMAAMFINNDLRNAEAHEAVNKSMDSLSKLGFDSASLQSGYATALDFVSDRVIGSIEKLNTNLTTFIDN